VSAANEDPDVVRPVLRVVRGAPTDDEVAALVTVVAALASRRSDAAEPPRSPWRNRARNIRPPIGPGPGAWRASGLPR
jgi:Acyl-CoA carboxylase epsilon subunit